jgi:hypothetical protein
VYRLRQVDLNGAEAFTQEVRVAVSTDVEKDITPTAYALEQNYPNPFNPETTIPYQLPERTNVRLEIYDMLGRLVAVPVDEFQGPGTMLVRLTASNMASGLYVYRLTAGEFGASRTFTILR